MMVTFTLWWLFTGALVWMLLDALGIVRNSRHSPVKLVAATGVVIVGWPYFAWLIAKHPRGAAKWFKRKLWGRP